MKNQNCFILCVILLPALLSGCASYSSSDSITPQNGRMTEGAFRSRNFDLQMEGLHITGRVKPFFSRYTVELSLSETPFTGTIGGFFGDPVSLTLGEETIKGRIRHRMGKDLLDLDEGTMKIQGEILRKLSALEYQISFDGMDISGRIKYGILSSSVDLVMGNKTIRGEIRGDISNQIYQLDSSGLNEREIAIFLFMDILRYKQLDKGRHSSGNRSSF